MFTITKKKSGLLILLLVVFHDILKCTYTWQRQSLVWELSYWKYVCVCVCFAAASSFCVLCIFILFSFFSNCLVRLTFCQVNISQKACSFTLVCYCQSNFVLLFFKQQACFDNEKPPVTCWQFSSLYILFTSFRNICKYTFFD